MRVFAKLILMKMKSMKESHSFLKTILKLKLKENNALLVNLSCSKLIENCILSLF